MLTQESAQTLSTNADVQGAAPQLAAPAGQPPETRPQEAKMSEESYKDLVENATDLIQSVTPEGRFLYVNRAWRDTLGYSEEEISRLNVFDIIHPDDVTHCKEVFGRLLSGERISRVETAFVSKAGERISLEGSVSCQFEGGKPVSTRGIFRTNAERRAADEELRKLSRAVEQSPAIVVITDTAGNIDYVNPKFTQVTGYSFDEVRGKNPRILKSGETSPEEYRRLWATITSGGEWRGRFRNKKKNGELYWESASVSPITDHSGAITHFLAVKEDVTERMRNEQALAQERNILRTLIDNLPDYIFVKDLLSRIVLNNQAHAGVLHANAPEEVVGKRDSDFFPSDLAARYYADEQAVLSSGEPMINREETTIDAHGRLQWLLTSKLPLRDPQGRIVGLVGISRDVTERKHAEEMIHRQTQYLEALIRYSPVAIVVLNSEQKIDRCNLAFEQLYGYSESDVVGRDLDELITTESSRDQAAAYTREAIQGLVHGTGQRRRKDGTLVEVEILGVPVIVDGVRIGTLAIYHDITDLKRAQRDAEGANEAKSAFLATMSHEIRTPMNGIIGMTSLLLDTELTPEQKDYAVTIHESGDALLTLINDILDFSKIEAGRLELEKQPFDLRECIESALDLVAGKANEKGLDLAYLISDGTPAHIIGDATRLRQVLINLLSNGIKFTDRGEVIVQVDLSSPAALNAGQDGNGSSTLQELHFAVSDTGIGIPPDRLDRLFKSFSQIDASTTRRYGGTGLGLAISKRLCELMGGKIWLESRVAAGSTFHFTIRAEASPSQVRLYLRGNQPQLSGNRVLIVDDNLTNRRILTHHVQAWSMLPYVTASPLEALDRVRRGERFDVAILDMQMPEMDGVTLATEIRRCRDAESLPLILLTSLGRREAGAEGVGFSATLTKPLKPSQLYDALVSIFADRPHKRDDEPAARSRFDSRLAERVPLRILVAEDHPINQKLALQMLKKMGYRADVAANGVEVLQALARQPYDAVLMDIQMPEMDGLEAARRICAQWSRDRRPRLIAMTANVMQGDRELCLAAGMDDYIGKPIQIEELQKALERSAPLAPKEPAPGESGAAAVVDWAILAGLSTLQDEGQPDFVQEMIDLYLANTPPLLEQIRKAIGAGNSEALRHAAHALKGNSRSLGLGEVGELCDQLEQMARGGTLEGAETLRVELEHAIGRAHRALASRYQAVESGIGPSAPQEQRNDNTSIGGR